ncbi:MAG TPA: tripartite tricarboxylate transporter substrate binding protein [Pseudolabrys sp.]|jgi:tripartite-type tricarboxylate transporter receptor subunit TctC|nr:tripartite tricarboxylate transporter substrate binding protein [Pseudolabrys sp.]
MTRAVIAAALAAGVCLAMTAQASAEWPADRPIRLLVGFGPGGGTDIVSRILAQSLSELLHQSVVVENKMGAGGTIAAEQVARAEKDGYTALMTSPAHTVSAAMLKSVRYDAVKDFAPVSWVADGAFVIVARKEFPANDIKGLVALAKASPGKLNFGDVGVGSTQNFAGELLRQMTAIDVKHIPYRSTGAVVAALMAGELDYGVELAHAVQGQVQAGQLKILAVGGPARWPTLPEVPTVAESGVQGYAVIGWYGWLYPAGTPKEIVDKTNAALKEVLARPHIRELLAKAGAVVHVSTPAEFGRQIEDEVAKWSSVREKAGIEQR